MISYPPHDSIVFISLNPGQTTPLTLSTSLNLFIPNDYILTAGLNSGDPEPEDDTLTVIVTNTTAAASPPVVANAQVPNGTFTILTAQSSDPIRWWSLPVGGTLLAQGNTFVTPCLTTQTIYYCEAVGPCGNTRVADTVFIIPDMTLDAGLFRLLLPADTSGFSDAENVSLVFKNYGVTSLATVTLNYTLNGGPVVSEVVNATIPWGDSLHYTFAQTADLEFPGSYSFKIWVELTGDQYHMNDTLWHTVNNIFPIYGISKANDSWNADIGNVTLASMSNGNVTTTTNNPDATHQYTDFTQTVQPAKLSRGLAYPVSITSIFSGTAYNCCVKVFIDWNFDGVFEPISETAFAAGPGKTAFSGNITVPVNAHVRYTLIRVVLVQGNSLAAVTPVGNYLFGETEDYLVYVYPTLPQDIAITAILSPADTTTGGSLIHAKLNILNTGDIPLYHVPLAFTINQAQNVNFDWDGYLDPGSFAIADWQTTVSMPSSYIFCAFPLLPGDHDGSNDTLCKSITVGINNPLPAEPLLTISPNPCNQTLNIDIHLPDNQLFELKLQNLLGQTIRPVSGGKQTGNQRININTSTLPEGIYFVILSSGDTRLVKKINVIH
ncbi:MAG: GEVED domain-containing protein [Bacteroidetes bacterium]|nr:GEVED domain-containing protein [Bacteroidota bacterium]